jgi:hypothetical protein
MKRFFGVMVIVCLLAAICVLGTAYSQGPSELATRTKFNIASAEIPMRVRTRMRIRVAKLSQSAPAATAFLIIMGP